MFTRSEAEENLRTIRSLMERSTIYRAISAPTALVGGVLSVVACALYYLGFRDLNFDVVASDWQCFLGIWIGTLVLTAISNTYFIWRGAKQRSEPFVSSGMKLALISLMPSMLCAGFLTLGLIVLGLLISIPTLVFFLPAIWMVFYGLGLLATSHFAPRSITLLGWVFLFSGFAASCYLPYCAGYHELGSIPYFNSAGNFMMGVTFGLYHLIYAACTWPRKSNSTISGDEP